MHRIFKRKLHKKNESMILFCSVFKCFVFVVWCLFHQTLLSPFFAGLYECFLLEGDSSQKLCFSLVFFFFFFFRCRVISNLAKISFYQKLALRN